MTFTKKVVKQLAHYKMKHLLSALLIFVAVLFSQSNTTLAKSSYSHRKSSTASHSYSSKSYLRSSSGTHHSGKPKAEGVKRDKNGKIARSPKAKREFRNNYPCPSTGKTSGACPGYVIDHIKPLKKGGDDAPYNMQWQTKEDAKAKDKWE